MPTASAASTYGSARQNRGQYGNGVDRRQNQPLPHFCSFLSRQLFTLARENGFEEHTKTKRESLWILFVLAVWF